MNETLPIVAIIGRPNVGKSTLFNRLVGKRIAITTDIPGTTRDRLYETVAWRGKNFILIDTAGIELAFEERFKEDIQSQIEIAINEADLIIFMADVTTGISVQDENAAKIIRKSKKPAILAVNKADNQKLEEQTAEFYKLGLGQPIPISALSGRNTGDMLDLVTENLERIKPKGKFPLIEKSIKVAIIGRPNVGKSSLFNMLVNENRAIVNEVPGTTRDIVSTVFNFRDEKIEFVDTAGLRRRGKIGKAIQGPKKEGRIEKYSAIRSLRALDESDVALILTDAIEGIANQDLHLAGFAKDSLKGIILIVNKIDAAEEALEKYLPILKRKFSFIPFAPVVFVSAKTGKNIQKIFDLILKVKKSREVKIPTPKLNKILEKAVIERPPAGLKNKKPKIKYITQTGINPPAFTIFCSFPEYIHFSYKRYLENRLRKEFAFSGTAIKMEFREKGVRKIVK